MALPPNLDHDKLAEAALAILSLTAAAQHGDVRMWKGLDWDLMALLFQKGWISDPVSKAKSVSLTEEGERVTEECLVRYFLKT